MIYKNTKKKKLKIISTLFGLVLFFSFAFVFICQAATSPASSGSSSMSYTPMEKIPGFESAGNTFPAYITSIYKFGLWTVGIAALLMISIGGFMYITSAGNNAAMGKAKGYIQDAIIGLVMALCAYVILYTINPSLLTITPLKGPAAGSSSTAANGSGTSQAAQQQLAACNDWCNNAGGNADYTSQCLAGCQQNAQAAQQSASTSNSNSNPVTGGNCSQLNDAINNNNQGVPPATLKAVMGGGEGCNPALSSDGYGSCGYSQALPATRTACGITGTAQETCAKIQADPNLDVNCAAQTINNMQTYSHGACDPNDPVSAGCCYNGGQSNSDCHKNPSYATKVNNYISKYGTN